MDDMETHNIVGERVSELIEELMDLIRPQGICGNPACENDPHPCPEGPWMTRGWVLSIDISAEGDNDELETWTTFFSAKNMPTAHIIGLGAKIQKWYGG